ncbi:MAG: amino acid permease [Planctomycetota bacterium]|nr:amino acid permease [Planctomycetota bacterium]
MKPASEQSDSVIPHLGLWDAVSIIVGIVVGTSIFKTPNLVFSNVSGPWQGLGCWALGGLLALIGSLCYAELATTYPRMGGDYVYLTRALGRWVGFLFGWAQLAVILTGSIGVMAFAFGDYAVKLWGLPASNSVWFALSSVIALTALNLGGVAFGKSVQNVLSGVKVLGLTVIVLAGCLWGGGASMAAEKPIGTGGFGFAMVIVLYAFGGWNDSAFVAAEVRQRSRNMPLALVLGTGGITLIYLLVNAAYLWGLGFEGVRSSWTPAADVLSLSVGESGAKGMSLLVMLSALGAINGLIFTGSRVYVSLGKDHRVFGWLGHWSVPRSAPVRSLLAQAAIGVLMILVVGTAAGRDWLDAVLGKIGAGVRPVVSWLVQGWSYLAPLADQDQAVDRLLQSIGLAPLPWQKYFGGFDTLVAITAPVFWIFFLLTGVSLFVLRVKDRGIERPFAAPCYPLEPLIFCGTCVFMLYSAVTYAEGLTLLGLVPLLVGLPLYWTSRWTGGKSESVPPDATQD